MMLVSIRVKANVIGNDFQVVGRRRERSRWRPVYDKANVIGMALTYYRGKGSADGWCQVGVKIKGSKISPARPPFLLSLVINPNPKRLAGYRERRAFTRCFSDVPTTT